MSDHVSRPALHDHTAKEQKEGLRIPDSPSASGPGPEEKTEERVQVNLSKYVVEKLIKVWLDKGARPGTIKDICERSIRLWLAIFADQKQSGDATRFAESQTGQDLRRLSYRLDRDLGVSSSQSLKEAYVVRIGAHLAVSMLDTPGVVNPDDDLLHEVFAAAQRQKSRIGEEVVDRLRLAAAAYTASPETTVRELLKTHAKSR